VIEVQNLTKRYGPITAVDDVSFRVEKGEILGFLGPNGAGKTTTMRVLTGYMPAT
jgi:ABC-2 type transport system ATP-binding protein